MNEHPEGFFNGPTRHRCRVASRTLLTAALIPACASELASFTPRRLAWELETAAIPIALTRSPTERIERPWMQASPPMSPDIGCFADGLRGRVAPDG